MTRDYKPAARARATPSSGSGSSLLVGMVIGLLLGLGIALGVALYLNKVPAPFASRSKSAEPPPSAKPDAPKATATTKADAPPAKSTEKPRFDFYSILPGDDAAKDAKDKAVKEPARPAAPEPKEIFYLQAGAFHGAPDADNMKARLALLGIEAAIQTSTAADRSPLHRVRVGPFSRVEELNRTRETLKQNGIETTLIKGRETQH